MDKEDVVNVDEVQDEGGTVDTPETGKGPKTFTQEQVNQVVESRLRREREAYQRKLDEAIGFKTLAEENAKILEEHARVLDELILDIIAERTKDMPDSYRNLLSKLSVKEQLEFLADPANQVSKKKVPTTPKAVEHQPEKPNTTGKVSDTGLYYGV